MSRVSKSLVDEMFEVYKERGFDNFREEISSREVNLRETRYIINLYHCLNSIDKMIRDGRFEESGVQSIGIMNRENEYSYYVKMNLYNKDSVEFNRYDQDGDYKEIYADTAHLFNGLYFYMNMASSGFELNKEFKFNLNENTKEELKQILLSEHLMPVFNYMILNDKINETNQNIKKQKI